MRRPRVSNSCWSTDRPSTASPQRGIKLPPEEVKREENLSKPTSVGKTKGKKTRRGKRGGVRRRMQMQRRLFLETIIQEKLRDIRYSMEAFQTRPSDDVRVDGVSMDLAEMSIDSSDVECVFDYEHHFPDQLNEVPVNNARQNVDNGHVTQDQQIRYGRTGSSESTDYAGYDHVEYAESPGYYGYEHTGYGNECGYDYAYAGYGYDSGYGYALA